MKKLFNFIKEWSDALILLPVVLCLVVFNHIWVAFIDPTANVLDTGFVVILTFNILKWTLVMLGSYFIWQLYFRADIFEKGWQEKLTPLQSAIISIVLWLSVLITSYFILLRDL
jgi:hypothetical protein